MDDHEQIDEGNWVLYAARNYTNPQCYDILEFEEDLKRFKYVKRLLNRYRETGELRERLILNHIISLVNVFGAGRTTKMLFFRLEGLEDCLVPFLDLLGILPERVYGIGINSTTVECGDVSRDRGIVEALARI